MTVLFSRRACLPAAAALVAAFTAANSLAAQEACTLKPIGHATVAAVRDGRTLMLGDGRELRLAGIEAAANGRAALDRLAAGQRLRLEASGDDTDRYGRLVAFAFAGNSSQSLQQALVEQGQAQVSVRAGSRACALSLLAAERAARAAGRGAWGDPNFAPLRAENRAGISARVYVNFG